MSRRQLLRRFCIGAGGAALSAAGYAHYVEPGLLSITRKTIPMLNLPPSLDGLKIAQLTDLHFRPGVDDGLIAKTVAASNQEAPDLVVLTGDYIVHDRMALQPMIELLKPLHAKHGLFAVLGNHDGWYAGESTVRQQMRHTNFDFLCNDGTRLHIQGDSFFIAGTDSVWSGHANPKAAFRGRKGNDPALALIHEPDFFDTIQQDHRDFVQLSGHTHGGQCAVPFFGYAPITPKYGERYLYGHFERPNASLFVSRGLGTTGIRVRFGCMPELAILTMKAA